MSDAFLIERARTVAARLTEARCWHQALTSFGRGISTKWFDLNAADVAEAVIRLRELASAIEARRAATSSGAVHESATREGDAQNIPQ